MRNFLCFVFVLSFATASAQVDTVNTDSLKARLSFLASDKLEGRGAFSKGLYSAATFLDGHFKKAGLKPFPGYKSFFQPIAVFDQKKPLIDSNGYVFDNVLLNVIGVLDGKTKPLEAIIISAHYDHIGNTGEINNGANDNASGVAALMALMDYYTAANNNERTIIFCAFSGEELGLFGSTAFSRIIEPEQIVAMVNMDMIGLTDFGKNKFFITGEKFSNLGKIMKKNLGKNPVKLLKEPARASLFERSDNYPFAKLGIPAHTVMTTDDSFNCYHRSCDDTHYIDFDNLRRIVKALISGMSSLVDGTDTPQRIKEKFRD